MVVKLEKILVPLDGSEHSSRGLEKAIFLAGLSGAEITVVTVISVYPTLAAAVTHYQKYLIKQAEKQIKIAKSLVEKKGIAFRSEIILGGSIAGKIVNYAKSGGFDLIVIGSQQRSKLKEVILGSVADAVLHKSKVSVLLVR
jgi:nucleotide-binding universal stress UspA family protein